MPSDDFDPYYKWLGIPPEEQPPDHYRLLGVRRFENDPDVIDAAAHRQMAHLRTYQSGPRGRLSQKLLNEVAAAQGCLLGGESKTEYDRTLRQTRESAVPPPRRIVPPPPPPPRLPMGPPPERTARRSSPPADTGDPFAGECDEASEDALRRELRKVLADGVIDESERETVRRLRRGLGVSAERASRIYLEVKDELEGVVSPEPVGEDDDVIVLDDVDEADDDIVYLEPGDMVISPPPPPGAGR